MPEYETSLAIFSRASQMLAEADTIRIIDSRSRQDEEIAGIYAIFYKTQCIYIGESSNIRHRLSGHDYRGWLEIPGIRLFWFKDQNRKHTEKQLIELCGPLLNGRGAHKHYAAIHEARGEPCEWAPRYLIADEEKV